MIKISIFSKIIRNGYVLIVPILLWNLIFGTKLPANYNPEFFNTNIPLFIFIGENVFRTAVLILPLFAMFNFSTSNGRKGLMIYTVGCLVYFLSWLLLIYFPESAWSKSVFGFAAPAYTPLIWLTGISFLLEQYYFNIKYTKWHFIVLSILFTIFHVIHTVIISQRCLLEI